MDRNCIGETAGKLWMALGEKERIAVNNLAKAVGADATLAQLAAGWLAREEKVEFEKQGRTVFVKLTAAESEQYRRSAGK